MAVTGVFNADFAEFYTAVSKADQQLIKLTGTTEGLNASSRTFAQEYQKVDGVLGSLGINIAPFVKGLDDIKNAGSAGASSLGALGTAAAIAGAAMVGWQIGTFIDKWTGASKAIEAATNAITGWGQALATQTGGAQQDTITRAISQGADATISYTEAIKFNEQAMRANIATKIDWRQKLADAHAEVRALTAAQRDEIQIAQEAGASTQQLTDKYGVSALALKVLAEREDVATAARKAGAKVAEERAAAEAKLNEQYAKLMSDVKNANQLAIMEADAAEMAEKKKKAAQGWFDDLQKQIKATKDAAAAEKERIDQNQQEIDGLTKVGDAHTEAGAAATDATKKTVDGYQQVAQQITITGDAIKEWMNLQKYAAQANAILGEGHLFTTQSQRDRIAALSGGSLIGEAGPTFGGGTTTVSNSFNLVDSESNLARRVSELIMQTIRSGTQLATS